MKEVIDAVVEVLETEKNLPDHVSVKSIEKVKNPFGWNCQAPIWTEITMSSKTLYGGLVGETIVAVKIPRDDIESLNIEPALALLDQMVKSREALEASNGAISLWVEGYDDDPRELQLIPEVRVYFQALDEQFPFWFHVCTRIEHSLRMVFAMLVELTPVILDDPPGAIGYRFSNDDLNNFVRERLEAMQSLHATEGFDELESERIVELVINYFSTMANG